MRDVRREVARVVEQIAAGERGHEHHAPATVRIAADRARVVEVELEIGRLFETRAVRDDVGRVAFVAAAVGADADAAVAAEVEAGRRLRRWRRRSRLARGALGGEPALALGQRGVARRRCRFRRRRRDRRARAARFLCTQLRTE